MPAMQTLMVTSFVSQCSIRCKLLARYQMVTLRPARWLT